MCTFLILLFKISDIKTMVCGIYKLNYFLCGELCSCFWYCFSTDFKNTSCVCLIFLSLQVIVISLFYRVKKEKIPRLYCCCSFAQSCPTLCNPWTAHATFPVLHYLLELAQTHVHWVDDAIQPSHPLSSPFSSCLQSFPASGSFPMTQFFTSGGQSIGSSASTSVLPMNTQDWSPLG